MVGSGRRAPHTQFLRTLFRRAALAALALIAAPLRAEPAPAPIETPSPADQTANPIGFEADKVSYDDRNDAVIAEGNVVLRRDGQSVRADRVSWSHRTGAIVAEGNVRVVDADGNQAFSDRTELTDRFETGSIHNLLLALREGGRLAARDGTRNSDGLIRLNNAAYSACAVEDAKGCARHPSWRITAAHVIYDDKRRTVKFTGARLELFGLRTLPLPGLVVATDGRPISGLLIPDVRLSASNGVEFSDSYYLHLSRNRDVTATAYVFTKSLPMVEAQYRELDTSGAFQVTGYATQSRKIPISGTISTGQTDFRGYFAANGRFQFSPEWSLTGALRVASDRTFLRRYDISLDDRLRSMVNLEHIDDASYFSLAGWATQTLRVADSQGQMPIALPALEYRRRMSDPWLGGRFELQLNTLAITRTAGQDTQRGFASAEWDLSRITRWGQLVTLTGLVRGDVYHSDQNTLTATTLYRGLPGWQGRGIATAALDVKWPLVGALFGGNQVLTPHLQLVASPTLKNLTLPDEDSRALDLADTNLFALNRFPGYDRVEDGVRVTYGFDWLLERPGWRIATTIGQSYRFNNLLAIAPDGTGLSQRSSDIVGRTELKFRDVVKLTHRFRLDRKTLAVRRNEIDATVGTSRNYIELGYSNINRNISTNIEDLKDSEELRGAVRVAMARYWSMFGSGVFSLSQTSNQVTTLAKGFQPLRTRLGVSYADDCIELDFTWRRDYIATGDAVRGNTYEIHFALKNLGFR